jgi:acetoin utilization protein AcuB
MCWSEADILSPRPDQARTAQGRAGFAYVLLKLVVALPCEQSIVVSNNDYERKVESPAMKIEELMTKRVVTVGFDDTVETVKEIFEQAGFHHLLVVEDGELQGVVSDRDLLRALSPFIDTVVETTRDANTLTKRVHQIMSRKPITLRPDADVSEAIQLFLAHSISCIPIVDSAFSPVGIVSWRDVLKACARKVLSSDWQTAG